MTILATERLSITFGGVRAVDGVSFTVDPGEIFTIIGPNGAGKTSVINLISRVYDAAAGEVLLEGRDVLRTAPHRMAALGVVRTFQNIELFERATVLENLLLGCYPRRRAFLAEELGFLPRARKQEWESRRRVEEIIDFLEIGHYREKPVAALPYGARKVVELARALVVGPKLLLLDEPSSGLTVEETDDMVFWIRDIRDQLGITIVMIEHDMRLVGAVSDRLIAMNQGKCLCIGAPAEVQADPRVVESFLGRRRAHGRP